MRTTVYIDAFNLYYGALKGTPYKWLNIVDLARQLLQPQNQIVRVKYFTALVNPRPSDPGILQRQQLYLRALATLPEVEIVLGHYLSHVVSMPAANGDPMNPSFVKVIKTEEKGSDVNIATHMIVDAADNQCDCLVLISGDSDLKMPVSLARSRFGKQVGVLNPQRNICKALQASAGFYKHIRGTNILATSQLYPVLTDTKGTFHKPPTW